MRKRKHQELENKRKIFHIGLGTLFILLYAIGLAPWWVFGIILVIGYLTSYTHCIYDIPLLNKLLEHFDRPDAYTPGIGAIAFVQGFLIASFLFEKPIAIAAMIALVYGDGIASLIGYHHGRHLLEWNDRKTWEGLTSGFLITLILLMLILPWPAALAGSIAAMAAESIKKPHPLLDDNFFIPLITGIVVMLTIAAL